MQKHRIFVKFMLSLAGLSLVLSGCVDGTTGSSGTPKLSLDATNYSIIPGQSTAVRVSNSGNATANNVTATGLPAGFTSSTCASIPVAQSCALILTASSSAQGKATITVAGNNGSAGSAALRIFNNLAGPTSSGASISSSAVVGNTVYFGTSGAGVYQQSGGPGTTWTSINTGLGNQSIGSLIADNQGDLYAGTADGVYKLSVGTTTWQAITSQGVSGNLYESGKLAIDKAGYLYARVRAVGQTSFSLYTLAPNATAWTSVQGFSGTPNALAGDTNGDVAVFNGTEFLRLSAGAVSQTLAVPPSSDTNGLEFGTLAIDNSNADLIVDYNNPSQASSASDWVGSTSDGTVWTPLGFPGKHMVLAKLFPSDSVVYGMNSTGGGIYTSNGAEIDPTSPSGNGNYYTSLVEMNNNLYVGGEGFAITSPVLAVSQTSWSLDNQGLSTPVTNDVYFLSELARLYTGITGIDLSAQTGGQPSEPSVFFSTLLSNLSWTNVSGALEGNTDYPIGSYASIGAAVTEFNSTLFGATDIGFFDLQNSTYKTGDYTTLPEVFAQGSGNTVYAADYENGLYTSTDDGSTWGTSTIAAPNGADLLAIYFTAGQLYAGTNNYQGLYTLNTDGSWSSAINGTTGYDVDYITAHTGSVYAAYYNSAYQGNVCQISDGTCVPLTTSFPLILPTSIAFVGNTLYVGTYLGLYTLQNGAWVLVGLPGTNILSLTVDDSNDLILGTSAGTFELPAAAQ